MNYLPIHIKEVLKDNSQSKWMPPHSDFIILWKPLVLSDRKEIGWPNWREGGGAMKTVKAVDQHNI